MCLLPWPLLSSSPVSYLETQSIKYQVSVQSAVPTDYTVLLNTYHCVLRVYLPMMFSPAASQLFDMDTEQEVNLRDLPIFKFLEMKKDIL